jgi:hypothetical protein
MDILMVKFWRSMKLVEMCSGSGLPILGFFSQPMHSGGLYFLAVPVSSTDPP